MLRGILRPKRESPTRSATVQLDGDLRVSAAGAGAAVSDVVLTGMAEGVLVVDPGGQVAYTNRAAVALLGSRSELADALLPRGLRDLIEEGRGLSVESGPERLRRQVEVPAAALEVTILPARPAGTVVAILRDVTRTRSTERLRRDFVANASHELKTPVASILALAGAVRAAGAGNNAEAVNRFSSRLEHEAERLAALVGDLLALSRLEGNPPKQTQVALDRIVVVEVERLRARAESAGLTLDAFDVEPVAVSGSEGDLSHMVHNLIDNAIRYTPSGGNVTISTARRDGAAEVRVVDTGMGIPAPDLDRVFERFYRVDAARSRETGGTGLGLSIVRNVAEAHHGTVLVQSVVGEGSTFIVRLPLPE